MWHTRISHRARTAQNGDERPIDGSRTHVLGVKLEALKVPTGVQRPAAHRAAATAPGDQSGSMIAMRRGSAPTANVAASVELRGQRVRGVQTIGRTVTGSLVRSAATPTAPEGVVPTIGMIAGDRPARTAPEVAGVIATSGVEAVPEKNVALTVETKNQGSPGSVQLVEPLIVVGENTPLSNDPTRLSTVPLIPTNP